ncbi:hypothetical protein HAX54_010989, partial [Datura stramonium]|nr:hypothetical protein [Datura stramonium]
VEASETLVKFVPSSLPRPAAQLQLASLYRHFVVVMPDHQHLTMSTSRKRTKRKASITDATTPSVVFDEEKRIDQLRFRLNKMKNYYFSVRRNGLSLQKLDLRLTPSRMTSQELMSNFKSAIGSLSECPWIHIFQSL